MYGLFNHSITKIQVEVIKALKDYDQFKEIPLDGGYGLKHALLSAKGKSTFFERIKQELEEEISAKQQSTATYAR